MSWWPNPICLATHPRWARMHQSWASSVTTASVLMFRDAKSSPNLLDRTRRVWVAPALDGRYVLGQLHSRTAERASYRSGTAYVGIIGMIKKLKKVDFFWVPAIRSLVAILQFFSAP